MAGRYDSNPFDEEEDNPFAVILKYLNTIYAINVMPVDDLDIAVL